MASADRPIESGLLISRAAIAAFLVVLIAGCSSQRVLMPTPNLYQGPQAPALFEDLPEALRGSEIDLLFVTDRRPERDEEGRLRYGHERSYSVAFGSARVTLNPALPWDELERQSLEQDRSTQITLELASVEEQGRFPRTPWSVVRTADGLAIDPEVKREALRVKEQFEAELQRRLALSPKREILMFVHGFNNQFEDAAETLAEMWHFLGREHVPVLYTWPAGRGGMRGYTYDRESGEFTIFHLKNTIQHLAESAGVEKIHLLAHSRGTDVLTSALRELLLASRAAGNDNLETYRIENVTLAAPDLDVDVTLQRLAAEFLSDEVGEVTIYTSQGDRAISAAQALFSSRERMGRLGLDDVATDRLKDLDNVEGLSFVDLQEKADRTGHGYFHSSPEASSDLIMTIRYGMRPGVEGGRPLTRVGPVFWRIEPGYPFGESVKSK
jgi:esterase/lipase superfamily enzyme